MTKNIFAAIALALVCTLTGCNKEYSVEPDPTSVDGALKGAFEVVAGQYPVTVDGDNASFTLKVKRTDGSVPYAAQAVDVITNENSEAFFVAGFGYKLLGADGQEIEAVKAKDNKADAKQQLQVLQLKKGEEAELTISFKFNSDAVPAKVALTSEVEFLKADQLKLEGAIGKYGVKNFALDFNFVKQTVDGKYQYTSSPAGAYLYLKGSAKDVEESNGIYTWNIQITEDNGQGMTSGDFDGKLTLKRDSDNAPYYFTLTGDFVNYRFQTFTYNLKSQPIDEIFTKE